MMARVQSQAVHWQPKQGRRQREIVGIGLECVKDGLGRKRLKIAAANLEHSRA